MIYNFLKEKEAFERHPDGRYGIDCGEMEYAIKDLAALILRAQATGEAEFAAAFENEYSHGGPEFEADQRNLSLEKVPMDIRFKFKK